MVWMYFVVYGYIAQWAAIWQERPYHDDSTASRLLSEVKHRRAWLVLRWGTTLESQVLFFCFSCSFFATFHHTAPITYSLHLPFSTVHYAEPIAMPFFSQEKSFLLSFYSFLNYTNSTLIHISTLQFQDFNPSLAMGVINSLIIRINCLSVHKINVNQCKLM